MYDPEIRAEQVFPIESCLYLAISEAATATCSMGGSGGVLILTVGLSTALSAGATCQHVVNL